MTLRIVFICNSCFASSSPPSASCFFLNALRSWLSCILLSPSFPRLFFNSSTLRFIDGSTPTLTDVFVPMAFPIVLASIILTALTSPPIISPLRPEALIVLLAVTLLCRIESASILPPADTFSALSMNLDTILPPALTTALVIPWIPLLNVIFPPAITVAPSTIPLTVISPVALTVNPARTLPLTTTSPS